MYIRAGTTYFSSTRVYISVYIFSCTSYASVYDDVAYCLSVMYKHFTSPWPGFTSCYM